MAPNSTVSVTKPHIQPLPTHTSSSKGAKVGTAVGIVCLLLIVVMVLYWKQRNSSFIFRPLSERSNLTTRHDEISEEFPEVAGLNNPAYDSTAFSETYSSEPADIVTKFPTSGPLDGDQEQQALMDFREN
uniref:Uncharacterized protein n=1 Tax=Ciona savignyi TaxID=51511 RepID=H2ZNA4_CIOSA